MPFDKVLEMSRTQFEFGNYEYNKKVWSSSPATKRDWDFLDLFSLLGQGEHGHIYKGMLTCSRVDVAVKASRCSAISVKQILSEMKILANVGKHENVLYLLGANTSEIEKGKHESLIISKTTAAICDNKFTPDYNRKCSVLYSEKVYLILEFCSFGSLRDIVRNDNRLKSVLSSSTDYDDG